MSVFVSRLAAGACAAALFFSPAIAETAPTSASTALLTQAAQKARDFADYRYAYTVEHLTRTGEKEVAITLRFDPRLEGDARWQVLTPAEDALDKPQEKALKQLRKGEMEDSPILYDSLDEMIGDVELASETETEAIYVAQLDDDDAPKDALEVFITLNKPAAYISSIELKSKKPFKPAPVAKVMKLVQTQRFAAPEGDGPALIVSSEAHIEGEAMFKSFSTDTRQIFSEIEQVEVPAEESDEGQALSRARLSTYIIAMQKYLITAGIILLVAGLLWPVISKLGLGRLPGDIRIEREGFALYFPITTMIIVSIMLTLIFRWFGK